MIIPYRNFPTKAGFIVSRPIIQVKLILKTRSFNTWALLDSGADRAMINKQIGKTLGFDFKKNKPNSETQGIAGSAVPTWDSQLDIEVQGFPGKIFTANLSYIDSQSVGVLLGHKGFFEFFDIKFQTAQSQFEIEVA